MLLVKYVIVPKRLINTQCGSDYIPSGFSNSYDDYVKPNGINFYKLHPNYFYNSNNMTKIKVNIFINITNYSIWNIIILIYILFSD